MVSPSWDILGIWKIGLFRCSLVSMDKYCRIKKKSFGKN